MFSTKNIQGVSTQVDCAPLLDRKVSALRAHASQVGPIIDLIGPDAFRSWWATESFVEAVAEVERV